VCLSLHSWHLCASILGDIFHQFCLECNFLVAEVNQTYEAEQDSSVSSVCFHNVVCTRNVPWFPHLTLILFYFLGFVLPLPIVIQSGAHINKADMHDNACVFNTGKTLRMHFGTEGSLRRGLGFMVSFKFQQELPRPWTNADKTHANCSLCLNKSTTCIKNIFLFFYTVGRTPWPGDQPVARPLPIYRTAQIQNNRRQISMLQVGFEPTIPVFERAKTANALDRADTVIGIMAQIIFRIWIYIDYLIYTIYSK
jgi:hypothetical protein